MAAKTLYQRVLGPDFYRLPPILQRFHGQHEGAHATGRVDVLIGDGRLRAEAARRLRLPPPGNDIAVQLRVIPQGRSERWIRQFDGHCVESVQWEEEGFLLERSGPLVFVFEVTATETGLTFISRQNRMRRLGLPRAMSLAVRATAVAGAEDWKINVAFAVPLLGVVTTYAGKIQALK